MDLTTSVELAILFGGLHGVLLIVVIRMLRTICMPRSSAKPIMYSPETTIAAYPVPFEISC